VASSSKQTNKSSIVIGSSSSIAVIKNHLVRVSFAARLQLTNHILNRISVLFGRRQSKGSV